MTHEEKINYMRIVAGICCLGFTNEQLDKLVSLYELVIEKQGGSTVDDAIQIEHAVKEREKKRLIEKIPDETPKAGE